MDPKHTTIIILTNQDGLDIKTYIMHVKTELDAESLKQAIKDAAREYLNTDSGRKTWEDNCHAFNYGDFMTYVPTAICVSHGFIVMNNDFNVIQEDYNTALAEPDKKRS